MSLFKKLFGKKEIENPTKLWPLANPVELTFNLQGLSFCGVRFGTDFEFCKTFGKTDSFKGENGFFTLTYPDSGFEVEFNEGEVDLVKVIFGEDKFNPDGCQFASLTLSDGIKIDKETSEADLISVFGELNERDEDETEIVVNFIQNDLNIEAELNLQGKLKNIVFFIMESK